ncbi:MAG TPA: S-layer homology domain-containing protein [Clostridiaceae bacterium]|nr:S-layer homology domain-containing protein [Clostridiaceae bacterium]
MRIKRTISLIILISLVCTFIFSSLAQAEEVIVSDLSQEKINLMKAAGELIPPYEEIDESSVKVSKEEAISIVKSVFGEQEEIEIYSIRLENLGQKMQIYGSSRQWYIDFRLKNKTGKSGSASVDADTGEIVSFNVWENNYGQKNYIAKLTREEAKIKAEEYLKNVFSIDPENLKLNEEYTNDYYYRNGIKEPVLYNFWYNEKINGIVINNSNVSVSVDGTDGSLRNFYRYKANFDTSKLPSSEGVLDPEEIIKKYIDLVNMDLQYITIYEDKPYYGGYAPQGRTVLVYVPVDYYNMVDAFTGKMINYDGTEYTPTYFDSNLTQLDPDAVLEEGKPITSEEAAAKAKKFKEVVEELLGIEFQDSSMYYYYNPGYSDYGDVWNGNWNYNDGNLNVYLNISINCKTGRVNTLSIDKYYYNYEYDMKMKEGEQLEIVENVNWEQGKEKAIEVFQKLLPEQYGFYADQNLIKPEIKDEYLKTMQYYNYSFIRLVNGVKYRDNSMYISINRETGELNNIYFNWQDKDFPTAEDAISREKALEIFTNGLEAQLSYFIPESYELYKAMEEGKEVEMPAPRLAYFIRNKGRNYLDMIIDPKTGNLMNWSGKVYEPLEDISQIPDHPAKRSVELLLAQGIIKELKPFDSEITRGEVIKYLSFIRGMNYIEITEDTKAPFEDIELNSEYYPYIENALRYGIIEETGGSFNADEKITKDEFVRMLVNMLGYSELAKHSEVFNKQGLEDISDDMVGSIAICTAFGILPAASLEDYDGSSTVTFAEAAQSLYNVLYYVR